MTMAFNFERNEGSNYYQFKYNKRVAGELF